MFDILYPVQTNFINCCFHGGTRNWPVSFESITFVLRQVRVLVRFVYHATDLPPHRIPLDVSKYIAIGGATSVTIFSLA